MITLKSATNSSMSLVFEILNEELCIIHWGSLLSTNQTGDISSDLLRATKPSVSHSHFDEPLPTSVMREHSRGFLGHPTLAGHRNAKAWSTNFKVESESHTDSELTATLVDSHAQLKIEMKYSLSPQGILQISAAITNNGDAAYSLNQFTHWLPLPARATQMIDFQGRWSHERHPQRREIAFGVTSREGREGRSGHDYTIAQLAVNANTNFASGEVWSMSMAFSGNNIHHIERTLYGQQSIGAGELLLPGEIQIAPGETFDVAPVVASYSSEGLDGLTHNFNTWLRARPTHPTNVRPRPLTLNMWEAIYFDHDAKKIMALADVAAEIGVERMVLDDGWFHSRRNDHSGLGDWVVDPSVWPDGLSGIIKYINDKGIEFGLWFEGEMVQQDSDLYRAHPDWILHEGDRIPPEWRRQQVLDLNHPGAFDHVLGQVDKVLSDHNIAYIKWDHNRVLLDAGHLGQATVHNQTLAIYRMFDELRKRHPKLEIESCASGGARIDLGVIDHVDRFWTSDNNDALERQTIQRWTGLVIPPEMLGTHIGPTHGHQTGKTTEISFRAINALFGHAGIEWDITQADDEQRAILKSWAAYYKENRGLLHSGRVVRVDHPDSTAMVYGVVAQDKSAAIIAYMQHLMPAANFPAPILIPGLDPARNYRVTKVSAVGDPRYLNIAPPSWFAKKDGLVLSGSELAKIGITPAILAPENGILIDLRAI